MKLVSYERAGVAALVTIDRQERRNAIDGPTATLLGQAHARFEADPEARVLVLTGAGEVAFCAGADLKAIESFELPATTLRSQPCTSLLSRIETPPPLTKHLLRLRKPE